MGLLAHFKGGHRRGLGLFKRPIWEVHVSPLLGDGHLGEIHCWLGEEDATGQRGQVHCALRKHAPTPTLLVLIEGKVVQAVLDAPGTKQAVISGPISRANCSILPLALWR